jgi:Uncharacterized protein conserved in bacteria (DUF2188)
MPPSDYHVVNHPNGWAVERPRSKRPSRVVDTQTEAKEIAHEVAHGGVVYVHKLNGRIAREQHEE